MVNAPIKKFRDGNLEVAVWSFRGTDPKTNAEIKTERLTIQKSYTDKGGEWKNTNYLDVPSALRVALLLTKAYDWCLLMRAELKQIQKIEKKPAFAAEDIDGGF